MSGHGDGDEDDRGFVGYQGVLDVGAEDDALAAGEGLGAAGGGDFDFALKDLDGDGASGSVLAEGSAVGEADNCDAEGAILDEGAGGPGGCGVTRLLEDGVGLLVEVEEEGVGAEGVGFEVGMSLGFGHLGACSWALDISSLRFWWQGSIDRIFVIFMFRIEASL